MNKNIARIKGLINIQLPLYLIIIILLFSLYIALSISGHFFLFWLRIPLVKIVLIISIAAPTAYLIAALFQKFVYPRYVNQKWNHFLFILLLISAINLETIAILKKHDLYWSQPKGIIDFKKKQTYALSIIPTGNKNKYSGGTEINLLEIKIIDDENIYTHHDLDCYGRWQESESGFYAAGVSDGELNCSIFINPGAQIKILFKENNQSGFVNILINNDTVKIESPIDLFNPEGGEKSITILIPKTKLFTFTLALIADFILIWNLIFLFLIILDYIFFRKKTNIIRLTLSTSSLIILFLMTINIQKEIFSNRQDRIGIQSHKWPEFEMMLRSIEQFVPKDANLALIYPGKYPVSPLFGQDFSRHLIPIFPAPDKITSEWLQGQNANYLLVKGSLFNPNIRSDDGSIYTIIGGGNYVVYPFYELDEVLNSGLNLIDSYNSCEKSTDIENFFLFFSD